MKVRFKKEYCEVPEVRMAFELDYPEPIIGWDDVLKKYCLCWDTKLIGCVSVERMEPADESDVPAVDVFTSLSNL